MLNTQKDPLFTLVKSLTKAEKRSFKLYANRHQGVASNKFVQLFDVLDRLPEYDETVVIKKMSDTEKRHLPNLKRHLYKQILTSLRLIYIDKNIDIQIREQLDFARILYGKAMYMQSLKILERIKKIADEHHQDILHLEILEFQKLIEARHITRSRSIENKMEKLLDESVKRSSITLTSNRLSNLNIQIHGWYIQFGHIQAEEDASKVNAFFQLQSPEEDFSLQPTFFEKAHLYQAHFWRCYILVDFTSCVQYARQWVNLFLINPKMRYKDPDLYMRALYYLLTSLYITNKKEAFRHYLAELEDFQESQLKQLNDNSKMIGFTYHQLSQLNFLLLSKQYEQVIALEPTLQKQLDKYASYMDVHRILLFYYKFACAHFACGRFNKALDHLNIIINDKSAHLREDLFINARVLQILCLFELKQYDLIDYLQVSLRRAIRKSKEQSNLQPALIQGVRELIKTPSIERQQAFQELAEILLPLSRNKYEHKANFFLSPMLWVESKLQGCYVFQLNGIKV